MYSGYQEEQDNTARNVLGGVLGVGLLAGAGFGARSILKNQIAKKGRMSNVPNARGGQSGVRTKADVFKSAAEKYPDPGVGKDVQYRNPGSGGTDLSMLITDPNTGEIYRRGGGQSANQQRAATQGGLNLAKQDLGGENAPVITDNQYLASIRQSNTDLGEATAQTRPGFAGQMDYARNRVANSLEGAKRDTQGALTAVDQYKQMTGANPYTEAPRKGLLKEQEAGRQRIANMGNVVLADLQNEAFVEREANKVITDLRQNQTRAAAQDAINTAENQQDKRTLRNLRRDEDLDLNRTNVDYVQEFMTDRRIELANKGVTGMRAERIIAGDPNVKNAIELYAQTGDPNVFQMTRKDAASMPMTVKPQDSSFVTELSAVGEPEVSTGLFMKKDKRGGFTAPIEEKEIELINRRGEIEERQGELRGRIQQINEDENMFRAAAETKPRKGLSGMNEDDFVVSKLRQQREGLKQEGIQNAETLFDVNAELGAVRRDLAAEKEFGGRAEPKTFTGEPKRLFFEADETGKPVAGTFEVRSDREMQDTANKGGGGRNVANFSAGSALEDEVRNIQNKRSGYKQDVQKTQMRDYDDFGNLASSYEGDKTQTGSTVTRYGIERGDDVRVDETIKPSQVAPGTTSPYQNLDDETLSMISLMGKGADAELATKESVARSRGPRDVSGESLKVSEGLRRARIEGRDPKAFLRSYTGT